MSNIRVNWKTPKNLLKLSVLVALATIALKTAGLAATATTKQSTFRQASKAF
jgi:hypothetical protein